MTSRMLRAGRKSVNGIAPGSARRNDGQMRSVDDLGSGFPAAVDRRSRSARRCG